MNQEAFKTLTEFGAITDTTGKRVLVFEAIYTVDEKGNLLERPLGQVNSHYGPTLVAWGYVDPLEFNILQCVHRWLLSLREVVIVIDDSRTGRAHVEAPKDNWVPACGGTEKPFRSRSGLTLLYCWNTINGQHAYLNTQTDIFLTDQEAFEAMN